MSIREYDSELIEYDIEDVGFRSNTAEVSFTYNGENNGFSEVLAREFFQELTTGIEFLGHEITVSRPGLAQEQNSVYIPHKTEEEAEEAVNKYLEQIGEIG